MCRDEIKLYKCGAEPRQMNKEWWRKMHVLGKADEREVIFAAAYILGNLMTALKYLFAICTTNINLFFSNIIRVCFLKLLLT